MWRSVLAVLTANTTHSSNIIKYTHQPDITGLLIKDRKANMDTSDTNSCDLIYESR